jgi:hypothetical protein
MSADLGVERQSRAKPLFGTSAIAGGSDSMHGASND